MHAKKSRVSVIVLNYNGASYVGNCLRSIYRSTHAPLDIVFVDNASTDGSLEQIKRDFSAAHIIRSDRNRGFAGGMNLGIRFALEKFAPDFVLLLNSDAALEPQAISELVRGMIRDEKLGMASPLILSPDGKIWFEGGNINWLRMRCEHRSSKNSARKTDFLSGCALFVRKEVFRDIGLLDERFFLYYEDADFSLRAKKGGYKIAVLPQAKVFHTEESEKDKPAKTYWLVRSGYFFFAKNTPYPLKLLLRPLYFLRKLKNRFLLLLKPQNEILKSVSRAYADHESSACKN